MRTFRISALLLTAGLVVASGCKDDLLDKVEPNAPSTAIFWKTQDDAIKGVTAAYSGLQFDATYSLMWHFATVARSDEAYSISPYAELASYTRFIQTNTMFEYTFNMWYDFHRTIFRCNQVIAYVPTINMDETLRKRVVAEARFIRAQIYYDLSLLYGNLPLALVPSEPNLRFPQVGPLEVQAQVILDLQAAKADLPLTYDANNKGRVTRGAATALLGKVFLQQRRWAEASTQFAEIVRDNQYSLVPNYVDNFTAENENNSESVFEVQFSGINTNNDGGQDNTQASEGNRRAQWWAPPGVGFSDVQPHRWVYNEYNDRTTTGQPDPRREITLFNPLTPVYGQPFGAGGRNLNPTALWWRKYANDRTRTFENWHSPINIRLIRYADVLLMYAEALNEQGQTAAAVPFINQVRTRATLTPLVAGAFTQATLKTQLRHERVTELAGEGHRWADLLRYGLLDNQTGIDELKTRDPDFNNFDLREGKSKLLPIPLRDLQTDPNLRQNPGY
ncbi:RagB/SusD family nutrient uptake outer membrane protein [Hymenobacter sp.]|jgi:hypothetical protein|uniref:RagB/SusD family nutrient uptake outer membrane protein n=1 Tax=Hymenobacter sp. TaxID=1898978 RepID=UPI002ED8308C